MIGGDNSLSILREECSVIVWTAGGRGRHGDAGRDGPRGATAGAELTLSGSFHSPRSSD